MKFLVYRDANGLWRWTLKAANHKVIADSAEAYAKRSHALSMAVKVATLRGASVEVVE